MDFGICVSIPLDWTTPVVHLSPPQVASMMINRFSFVSRLVRLNCTSYCTYREGQNHLACWMMRHEIGFVSSKTSFYFQQAKIKVSCLVCGDIVVDQVLGILRKKGF